MSQIYVCIRNWMMLPCLLVLIAHHTPRCGNWLSLSCFFIIQSVDALCISQWTLARPWPGHTQTHMWMHTQKRAFCFRSLAALYNRYYCLMRTALFSFFFYFSFARPFWCYFSFFLWIKKSILMCPFSIEITLCILCENFSIFYLQKFHEKKHIQKRTTATHQQQQNEEEEEHKWRKWLSFHSIPFYSIQFSPF